MTVRVDKWLWAVRLFKTRSISTEACKNGKVSMDGKSVKPSKEIKVGDEIEVTKDLTRIKVKVLQLGEKRMGAALVDKFMEDLTPAEEYERVRRIKSDSFEIRDRGIGRPTKKDRRSINDLKNY